MGKERAMSKRYKLFLGDCLEVMKQIPDNSVDLFLSDIPYGISIEDWDVLHNNTNSALLGTSPAQAQLGNIFKKRGKPLNGWSEADKLIPKQYYDWIISWVEDWYRVLKPCGSAFIFAGRRLSHRCSCAFEDSGFICKDIIGWNKQKAAHRAQHISCIFEKRKDDESAIKWKGWKVGNLRPVFEPILWFMKPYKIGSTLTDNVLKYGLGAYNENIFFKYNQKTNNMLEISSQYLDKGLHPTQKPLKLMEFLIELVTVENSVIVDPFMGSGTTGVACMNLNRKFIGIEKEEKYFNIAEERIEKAENE